MENSANTITHNHAPIMTVVKKSSNTKKSASDNKIRINTLTPNFNFINDKGETIFYKALKI